MKFKKSLKTIRIKILSLNLLILQLKCGTITEIVVLRRQLFSKSIFIPTNFKNHCKNVPIRNFRVELAHF
jgi:hypothetical protein